MNVCRKVITHLSLGENYASCNEGLLSNYFDIFQEKFKLQMFTVNWIPWTQILYYNCKKYESILTRNKKSGYGEDSIEKVRDKCPESLGDQIVD